MSDRRARLLRARVEALSGAQRRALAHALGRQGTASERLVGFVVLDGSASPTDEALRAFLTERLPDYMIPSRFVVLDRLPRTAAGKLDRRALVHVRGTELGAGAGSHGPVAPRNALEARLAAIWRDVLKVDVVGVEDDFFELGGDSLLSIRVIARAGREGIRISPERFFERPTIAHVAAGAAAGQARLSGAAGTRAPLAAPIGDAPLTPIQHWFLDAIPEHRDWWNQAYLLELGHPLDVAQLSAIIRALVTHHDALRLRLTRRGGEWRQDFVPPDDDAPCRVVDLAGIPEAEYGDRVAKEGDREHGSLRLEVGRLFRCIVFRGRAGWCRLLLLGHHLVLDSISWSVILEDLATLVTQAARGERLALPEGTAPARAWAIALTDLASTEAIASSAAHWLGMPVDDDPLPPGLPLACAGESRAELAGLHRDAEVLTVTLDGEDARLLLHEAPRHMDASAQAVLLAALLLAWRDLTGSDTLRLDLEGHGRDVLGDALDVSRTVGWFTTVFPVQLALPRELGARRASLAEAAVHAVRSALDAVPRRGAAHGLARYLAPDERLRTALAAQRRPALLFNLLGAHDVTLPSASRLRVTDEPHGRPRSPDAPRAYLIELNARIERGSLIVSIEYARRTLAPATMARFAETLREGLLAMAHRSSVPVALPGIDASSLAIVADMLAELDDA